MRRTRMLPALLCACALLGGARASVAQEAPATGTLHLRLVDDRDKSPLADTKAAVTVGRLEQGRDVVYDAGAGKTDAEGCMKFPYAPGRLQVQIHVPGYAYALSKLFTLEPNMDHRLEFSLAQGATVSGRVISKLFAVPVDDAKVSVMTAAHSANVAATSVGGTFEFRDLPAGSHRIRIEHPDHAPRELDFTAAPETPVDLDRIPLDPAPNARISLRVYVPGKDAPVRDYDVVVTWTENDKPVGFPGAVRGIDEFLVKVPPGPVTLKVELAGFRPALVAVLVPRGLTVPVRVHLQPAKE